MKSLYSFIILLFIYNSNNILFVESTYLSPSTYTFNSGKINYFGSFGFLKGGHFSLHATKKPAQFKRVLNDTSIFGLCTFDQLDKIGDINPCNYDYPNNNYGNDSPEYSNPSTYNDNQNINSNHYNSGVGVGVNNIILSECKILNLSTENETIWRGEIDETNYYSYVYFSCFKGSQTINIEISFENLNPSNNHLSMEYLMFPSTILSFVILWVVLSILWFINWLMNRDKLSSIPRLHIIISLVPISTLLNLVYSLIFYEFIKKDGALGLTVIIFNSILYSLQLVVLLLVLMLISLGYGIVPKSFKRVKLLIIIIGIIIFVGTFIGSYYSGHYNYVILITYLPVALFIIFVAQNNVKRIKAILELKQKEKQIDVLNINGTIINSGGTGSNNNNNSNNNENDIGVDRIRSIYYLFVGFKWIMVPYVLITIIVSLVSIYVYQPWVFLLIQLVLNATLFIMIAITFRLKRTKKHSFYEFFDENTFNKSSSNL